MYSGIQQNLQTTKLYNFVSISPLPSFMHGLDRSYFVNNSRVSLYAPASAYLQMYQNNFVYFSVIAILFGFFLSGIILFKTLIIRLNLKSIQIKIISYLSELFLLVPLLYGFQYDVRTMMRYYWIAIFALFVIPLFFARLFKKKLLKLIS